jgi:hypothetical protein
LLCGPSLGDGDVEEEFSSELGERFEASAIVKDELIVDNYSEHLELYRRCAYRSLNQSNNSGTLHKPV